MSDHIQSSPLDSLSSGSILVNSILSNLIQPRLSLLSSLPSRLSFASQFYPEMNGSLFAGNRNLYQIFGYDPYISIEKYRLAFERGGIATRIVSAYPEDTWSDGFDIYEDPDPDNITPWESTIEQFFTRIDFLNKCERMDILAGIGHYGVLMLNIPSLGFEEELPKRFSLDSIVSVTPLDELRAKIDSYDKDEKSERFGLPLYYLCQLGSRSNPIYKKVHHSHILHFVDGALESDIFGTPRLRSPWNRVIDLEKILGSGAEASLRRQDPGMHVKAPLFDKDGKRIVFTDDQIKDVKEKFDKYDDGESKEIFTQGLEIDMLSAQVWNFGSNADSLMSQIAGIAKIPKRKFIGSEEGKQAADQDSKGYDANVNRRKMRLAIPFIRKFIDLLTKAGALPQVDEYFVEPIVNTKLPPQDQSNVALRMAQTNQAQSSAGGTIVFTEAEIRDISSGLQPLEEDLIDQGDGDGVDPESDSEDSTDPNDNGNGNSSRSNLIYINPVFLDSDPEWRIVHKVGDIHRKLFSSEIRSQFRSASESIDYVRLLSAIERGDSNTVDKILRDTSEGLTNSLIPALQSRIQDTMSDAGRLSLRAARKRGSWFLREKAKGIGIRSNSDSISNPRSLLDGPFAMSFNEVNPRAVTYALTRSSTLVSQITPSTLSGLQRIISQSQLDGIPPRRQVSMIKEWIGLRDDQVKTLESFASRLRVAKPGSTVKAGNSFSVKVPRKGITSEFLQTQQDRYAEKLLRQRALLIARTESMRSANSGLVELWQQGQENGLLPDTILRVWIVTDDERLREAHAEMEDQTAKISEPFSPIAEPGTEPNCRCGQGLIEE